MSVAAGSDLATGQSKLRPTATASPAPGQDDLQPGRFAGRVTNGADEPVNFSLSADGLNGRR